MALDGTIDIAGKPVKKQTVLIGVAAAGILGIGFYRYRKQQAATAATAAADAAAQAPGTGAGTSDQIDPATGFPYGSAEDAAAMTAQSGYNSPIAGLGYSDTSYLYGGGAGYPGSVYPTSGGFTSNAQWTQAVEAYLTNTTGADANTVGNALGKYITGQPVDAGQQAIISQAVAFEGNPPVAGPDGYPPNIRTAAPTPIPTPQSMTTVPNVVGGSAGSAHNAIVAAHLIPVADPGQKATQKVKSTTPRGGTKVATGTRVLITT